MFQSKQNLSYVNAPAMPHRQQHTGKQHWGGLQKASLLHNWIATAGPFIIIWLFTEMSKTASSPLLKRFFLYYLSTSLLHLRMNATCIVQRRAFDPLKTRVRDDWKPLHQRWGLNLCSVPLSFARVISCNFLYSLSQFLKTVSLGLTSWRCCSLCWANLLKALEWARHHCSIHPMSWLPRTILVPSKCLHVPIFSVFQNHPDSGPEETCLITT